MVAHRSHRSDCPAYYQLFPAAEGALNVAAIYKLEKVDDHIFNVLRFFKQWVTVGVPGFAFSQDIPCTDWKVRQDTRPGSGFTNQLLLEAPGEKEAETFCSIILGLQHERQLIATWSDCQVVINCCPTTRQ